MHRGYASGTMEPDEGIRSTIAASAFKLECFLDKDTRFLVLGEREGLRAVVTWSGVEIDSGYECIPQGESLRGSQRVRQHLCEHLDVSESFILVSPREAWRDGISGKFEVALQWKEQRGEERYPLCEASGVAP